MAVEIKFELIEYEESELLLPEYCNGKFENLNDDDLESSILELMWEAIEENGVYYDPDDAEKAVDRLYPTIKEIVFNPQHYILRYNYKRFAEFVTYMTVRLA